MANTTALGALQAAIYARLKADPALTAAVSGVWDEPPEGAAYPYVVIGDAVETPDNNLAAFGSRVVATLHVWSSYRGFSQANTIAGHLMRLLDHQPLTVAGRGLIAARHEQTITMRDPDTDVRHVAVRFAFETYPTT